MDREYTKLLLRSFKATNDSLGTFIGYVAVFNNVDGNGDIILPGAFTKTLATARKTKAQSKSPYLYPLLWQHDETEPIGGITDASEDTNGLLIQGQYDLDTVRGAQAYSGAKKGYLTGLSIGYRTVKSSYNTVLGCRELQEINLFEASPVTFPANELAGITNVKHQRPGNGNAAPRADMSYADALRELEQQQQLEHNMVVMELEAKAVRILHDRPEIAATIKRVAQIDAEQTRIRAALSALAAVPDSTESVAKLRADLARLDRERDEANPEQARWRDEIRAIRERHQLERASRKRGERVPNLQADPEAYVLWLQRQRALPYVEMARDLNEQSRHSQARLR